jgi:AraC-like DNA-binding protein
MNEKHAYTVAEVAALTGFSRQTVTRMFEKEKGVLIVERPETLHKRKHRSIRIPRAVYERVIRRVSV